MDNDRINELFKWETILFGRQEAKRRKRVRQRRSYSYWERMWKKITQKNIDEILWMVHTIKDRYHGYGYASHAHWAEESLALFLEDMKSQSSNNKDDKGR